MRAYGTEAADVLSGAETTEELGRNFGADLTERELRWLMTREYARTAEDVVWRRSKQGLRLTAAQIDEIDAWMRVERRAPEEKLGAAE